MESGNAVINLSLDLNKIPKGKIKKGAKGNYVDITVFVSGEVKVFEGENYRKVQNASAVISQTAEEREAKATRQYIGNGAVVYVDGEIKTAKELDVVGGVAEKVENPLDTIFDEL